MRISADGPELRTRLKWHSRERSFGMVARNDKILFDHLVSKRVRIGYEGLENLIEFAVTFAVPPGERHTYAQFEALTGYMPSEFGQFWRFLPRTGELRELDDGPGEQGFPVVFATAGGTHAMAVFSLDQPSRGYEQAGCGRFRFQTEKVVKWNRVFRVRNDRGMAPGDYPYRLFVAIGSREDVRQSLALLVREFPHGDPRTDRG